MTIFQVGAAKCPRPARLWAAVAGAVCWRHRVPTPCAEVVRPAGPYSDDKAAQWWPCGNEAGSTGPSLRRSHLSPDFPSPVRRRRPSSEASSSRQALSGSPRSPNNAPHSGAPGPVAAQPEAGRGSSKSTSRPHSPGQRRAADKRAGVPNPPIETRFLFEH